MESRANLRKSCAGDWEEDTVISGRYQGALLIHVNQASKFIFIELLTAKKEKLVTKATRKWMKDSSYQPFTIIDDNSKDYT